MLVGELPYACEIAGVEGFSALGVLETDQPCLGEVVVVGLDGRRDVPKIQASVVPEG